MNLYEIHISVNLTSAFDEMKWFYYCKDNKYKVIRVLNDKGKYDIQNMISKWCSRKTPSEVVKYAEEIADDMRKNDFDVYRVKVEARLLSKLFDNISLKNEKGVYWEFHFKIVIESLDEFNKLVKWKQSKKDDLWKDVALSFSAYGKTGYPIITIRLYSGTSEEATSVKDKVIDDLKENGFHIADKMQSECSIYDTYPEEDNGWINL